jgi:hypothetical protein
MRKYLVAVAVAVMALAMSAVGANATPSGVYQTDSGLTVIHGEAVANASLPDSAVSYAAYTLGG